MANHGQRFACALVPQRLELAIGFVEDFKEHLVILGFVTIRDLSPQRQEALEVRGWVGQQLVVLVNVDDDAQAQAGGVTDRPIDAFEKRRINRVRRCAERVSAPFDGQPNGGETRVFHELKVIFFQCHAPRTLGRSLERIAVIDANTQLHIALRNWPAPSISAMR